MSTSTKGFEELFLARLEELLAERHPSLELEVPTSGSRLCGPTPDFVVSNPETGSWMGGKLKGGFQAKHLPLAMLPHMRALREQFRSDHPQPGDFVVITTGRIPNLVQKGLNHDGIGFLEVSSPEEGAERVNERLGSL
jgi:hypothetical protein